MAKDKRWYYECVMTCQIGYMGLDHRRERWEKDEPTQCLHVRIFKPTDPYNARKPADILALERPIARRYTDEVDHVVERKDLTTGKRYKKGTHSKVKFVLLDPEDITADIRARSRFMTLRECDYEPLEKA